VTSTVVFEGEGRPQEYVGGYDDWLMQRNAPSGPPKATASKEQKQKAERPPRQKQKLSYKESRDLEALPQTIEVLEEEKRRLTATLSSPEFYVSYDPHKMRTVNDRLEVLEKELDEAYHRWDELESLAARLSGEPESRRKSGSFI
jgi:ABC transport system ATP-binding/permease protein